MMKARAMSRYLYRADTDWLLVRLMTFDGSRYSARRLGEAEQCATIAREIMDMSDIHVYADKPGDLIRVKVTRGDEVLYSRFISPCAPHFGLRPFLAYLRGLRDECATVESLRQLRHAGLLDELQPR